MKESVEDFIKNHIIICGVPKTECIIDADAEQAKRNDIRTRSQTAVIVAEEVEE